MGESDRNQRDWIHDAGEADFEREVIERSKSVPLVVDFWAPWCGPCRTLAPILERLIAEQAGAVHLVRINSDEAPWLAEQLGVRSIPTLLGFRDGRIVAELVGAQPEPVVRRLVETLLPTRADRAVEAARRLAAEEQNAEAEALLREALAEEPHHGPARLELARLLAGRGEREEALRWLEGIGPGLEVSAEAERLAAKLRTEAGRPAADPQALRARVTANPDDLDARIELGRALAAANRHEEALAELLEAVRRDPAYREEAARRAMLDLFAVLGSDHPLTVRYRRELARALFR